jgi:DNA-directed RNA polymerase specialized sigma24 family protein
MDRRSDDTHWLVQLKAGRRDAAQPLWERYYRRLVLLARARLANAPRRAADEEDVALSAFDSFCRGAEQGRFPRLDDRDDLWQVLVMITVRKAANLCEHERRQKRGGGEVRGDSALAAVGDVVGDEPTPSFACEVAEQCRRLLDALGDDTLRAVAVGKLEGYTNPELAERLGCSLAAVERKLNRIRLIWQQMREQG